MKNQQNINKFGIWDIEESTQRKEKEKKKAISLFLKRYML